MQHEFSRQFCNIQSRVGVQELIKMKRRDMESVTDSFLEARAHFCLPIKVHLADMSQQRLTTTLKFGAFSNLCTKVNDLELPINKRKKPAKDGLIHGCYSAF